MRDTVLEVIRENVEAIANTKHGAEFKYYVEKTNHKGEKYTSDRYLHVDHYVKDNETGVIKTLLKNGGGCWSFLSVPCPSGWLFTDCKFEFAC